MPSQKGRKVLSPDEVGALRKLRNAYLTFFLFSTLVFVASSMMGFQLGFAALAVLVVFFAINFAKAMRVAFGFSDGGIAWRLILVLCLPFMVNVPLFMYDRGMYKLTKAPPQSKETAAPGETDSAQRP
jgi:hypothetical protein